MSKEGIKILMEKLKENYCLCYNVNNNKNVRLKKIKNKQGLLKTIWLVDIYGYYNIDKFSDWLLYINYIYVKND